MIIIIIIGVKESLNDLKETPPVYAGRLGDWLAEGIEY